MQQYLQNKKGLVQNVFNQVYDQYDLMNDFMSLGVHRLWKKSLLNMMNPSPNQKLIDVACGTGDIAKLFLNYVNKSSNITCVDPNKEMIKKGKEKLNHFENLNWIISHAEKLLVSDNSFDFVFTNILDHSLYPDKSIAEIERVLKKNGHVLLQITVGEATDKYGVTEIKSERGIIKLFKKSEIIFNRSIKHYSIAQNWEILSKKKY